MRKHNYAEIVYHVPGPGPGLLSLKLQVHAEGDGDLDWGQMMMGLNTSCANFLLLL